MTTPEEPTPAPAAEDRLSRLGQLKARRQEIFDGDHLDLAVPRWTDPEIIVRYKPVAHSIIKRGQNRIEAAQKRDKDRVELEANMDVLVAGCIAVFARLDGQDYSLKPGDPKGELTKFDGDLADNLGLHENATAREVVRALFIADGDIFSHASKLSEFSGYRETEADEGTLGE